MFFLEGTCQPERILAAFPFTVEVLDVAMGFLFLAGLAQVIANAHLVDGAWIFSVAPQIEVIDAFHVQGLSELFLGLEAVLAHSPVFLSLLNGLSQIFLKDLIFSVLVSVHSFGELHVADTMLAPFIVVEVVSLAYSPLWPHFFQVGVQFSSRLRVELIVIVAIGVRAFSSDTSQILGIIRWPVSVDGETLAK